MKMTTWDSLHFHQHFSTSKIHLEHLDHRFRIFIKSVVEDIVCSIALHPEKRAWSRSFKPVYEDRIFRVEESLRPENRAIKASPGQWSVEGVH
jgi:hypothetical protein